ncbi:glycosyltransferase [Aequorivita marina]|uniref:glycosyltransferase n=1 Tax=Aequorivita marina TaxID=3073654 RepID=UPI0028740955|nr:glycosyltransferase [Aequorivita sp. S2608]MDS1299092.1 glycosyltransferase [Aequorivita sp. S2608]
MIQEKSDPRITILMAIYNCAPTLAEAIDSIYAQTYTNFKLVLCDDGSTDDTYKIAQEYADRYPNIILLKNEKNIKLAASLNRCLEYADTEYIARMDGDDISLPSRFEKQINFLDSNPKYAVVSSPMIYFDENGDWGEGKSNPTPGIEIFKKGAPHPHAPCMVRTEVMKEVKGYTVSPKLERGQDYYLFYKIYKAGHIGYNLQEPLYKMRDDKNAMARRTLKRRYNAFLIKMEILRGLGVKNGFIYALPSLIKGFIPSFIMKEIRQKRMGA